MSVVIRLGDRRLRVVFVGTRDIGLISNPNNVFIPPAIPLPWILQQGSWNDGGLWYDTSVWNDGDAGNNWILVTGYWNDNNEWIDIAGWNDGVSPSWFLETGFWNDLASWVDTAVWVD